MRSHRWHVAARLGPQARDDATNYIQRVEETPPASRRACIRGALDILHAPLQVGVPATMNSDSILGFRSWETSRLSLHWAFVTVGEI